MEPAESIGREQNGGTRAIQVEEAVPSVVGWRGSDTTFALALSAIALHAMDSRLGGGPSLVSLLLDAVVVTAVVLVAVWLFRRSGRGLRALLALVAGTGATIAGLGTTAGYIWKLGPAGIDAIGLISLSAGLVLLAMGTVAAIRAAPGWRRLLALPVAVLALAYVFAPLTIAVFLTHQAPARLGGLTPADEGLTFRDVTLTARDGTRLAGWYVPSRNGAAVVVLHGSGSSRLNVLEHIGVLGRAGYGVMAIDARGHGRSGGEPMDLGWLANLDIGAGVSYLSRQDEVGPGRIAVLGVSMGGVGALTAGAADPRIGAVIAEGVAVASFQDSLSLGSDRWWKLPFYWMASMGADLLSPGDPPMAMEDAVARVAPRPVLLISGRGSDESFLNRRYVAAGSPDNELLELPDTKHSLGIWRHRDRWTDTVLGFLDRALLR
jgi:alpha-beta hydrolase superfamily lysophospholipase